MKQCVYTSISLSEEIKIKFELCVEKLGVDEAVLLSVLCYKAGKFLCKKSKYMQTVDYQERGKNYTIKQVYFFAPDHEYMHSNRLACKVSVSKLLARSMELFLDEILQKGINQMEIAHLRVKQNSYQNKAFFIRNLTFKITKNHQFEEYAMKMRMDKT